jgi:hypothetical protein
MASPNPPSPTTTSEHTDSTQNPGTSRFDEEQRNFDEEYIKEYMGNRGELGIYRIGFLAGVWLLQIT